jgi:hypothetical protein
MLCFPTARLLVGNVATPLEFNIPIPRAVVPSLKVTLPVGTRVSPFTAELTVVLNVTGCPNVEGFAEDVGVLVELPTCPATFPTTWTNTADVLPVKLASPAY